MDFSKEIKKAHKYFGISLPLWMESRKTLFLFSLLDFLLIYKILNDLYLNYDGEINLIRIFCFISIWSFLSYLNGRYSYFKEIPKKGNKLYKLLTNSILVALLTYGLDKALIIFFSGWNALGRNNMIKILILSYLIQSLKFLINNSLMIKDYIFLVGSENKIKNFNKYCDYHLKNKKIIVKNFSKIDNYLNNFKTIILLDNNYDDFFVEFSYLMSDKSEIITASKWCEKNIQRIPTEYISEKDLDINNLINPSQNFNWRLKRFGDILISLILLIISSPLIIFFAILIKIEDKGPIFYSQERTGLYGKIFKIVKLRSMKINSEKEGPVWAKIKDPRITNVGKLLRRSRIDELPQLWSVIKGEMSLIGPRPERPEIEELLVKEIPFYNYRNTIRPGLSGWAQVNYRYGSSIQDSKRKFSYEVFYLRNYSFLLDFLIFFKTLKLVIKMEGSNPK